VLHPKKTASGSLKNTSKRDIRVFMIPYDIIPWRTSNAANVLPPDNYQVIDQYTILLPGKGIT